MSDRIFQDRDNAGKTISGKLMSKVEDSANDYRTVVISDGDTTTMLKTKGGTPEVTQTRKVSAACVLFPLVEKTLAGATTQADRLYYHDHEADAAVPERRKFSSDGLLSLLVKPLRRLRLHSEGLAKYITVWFADYSGTPTAVNQSAADYTAVVSGIKATESALTRTYHTPVFIPHNHTPAEGSDLKKLGFVFKRIKDMLFDTAEYGQFKVVMGNHTSTAPGVDVVGTEKLPSGASERLGARTFYGTDPWPQHKVKELFFTEGKLTVATPGGIMEPVRTQELDVLDPQQHVYPPNTVRPLTSLTDLVTFGKIWHGFLEDQNNGAGPRILWDSAEKTRQLLVHNTNPSNGPVVDIVPYTYGGYDRYYKFPSASAATGGAAIPDGAAFKDYAILNTGRLGCLVDSPLLLPNNTLVASDILYKDGNGAVWKITVAISGLYITVTVTGRLDDFMETKTTCSVQIANLLSGGGYKMVVKNSPDSKKAAIILYGGSTPATALLAGAIGYYLLDFSGNGSTETATYGQGIVCTSGGALGWETDGGPLGRIYQTENISGSYGNTSPQPFITTGVFVSSSVVGSGQEAVYTNVSKTIWEVRGGKSGGTYTRGKTQLLQDIVFNRKNGNWERVDLLDVTVGDSYYSYTGFEGEQLHTVVSGYYGIISSTSVPESLEGRQSIVSVGKRSIKLSTQNDEQALVGTVRGESIRLYNDQGVFGDEISYTTSSSGLPLLNFSGGVPGLTYGIQAVGDLVVGYPYIGRYVYATVGAQSWSSSVCYENAVSDFVGKAGLRIAYDPVNEKIVATGPTTYGAFV